MGIKLILTAMATLKEGLAPLPPSRTKLELIPTGRGYSYSCYKDVTALIQYELKQKPR